MHGCTSKERRAAFGDVRTSFVLRRFRVFAGVLAALWSIVALEHELTQMGLWTGEAARRIEQEGFATLAELAYSYGSAEDVMVQAPCVADAWLHVKGERRAAFGDVRTSFVPQKVQSVCRGSCGSLVHNGVET